MVSKNILSNYYTHISYSRLLFCGQCDCNFRIMKNGMRKSCQWKYEIWKTLRCAVNHFRHLFWNAIQTWFRTGLQIWTQFFSQLQLAKKKILKYNSIVCSNNMQSVGHYCVINYMKKLQFRCSAGMSVLSLKEISIAMFKWGESTIIFRCFQ